MGGAVAPTQELTRFVGNAKAAIDLKNGWGAFIGIFVDYKWSNKDYTTLNVYTFNTSKLSLIKSLSGNDAELTIFRGYMK